MEMHLNILHLQWLLALCSPGLATALKDETWSAPTADDPYEIPPEPSHLNVDRPNIIMFMPDQLRFDAVGAFGNPVIKTPNIKAFAKEAVKFTNTFAQASTCSASMLDVHRWGLMTSFCTVKRITYGLEYAHAKPSGQYPHVNGHRTLQNLLKSWEPNVFRSMKEAGYHVAYLATRGDFYAENATELGVDEYGLLPKQTLPPFSNHEQHFQPITLMSPTSPSNLRNPRYSIGQKAARKYFGQVEFTGC